MSKRRITLELDVDVAEALESVGDSNMSAVANEALPEAFTRKAHQAALLAWLDELDAKYGAPTQEQLDEVDAVERGDLDAFGNVISDTHGAA